MLWDCGNLGGAGVMTLTAWLAVITSAQACDVRIAPCNESAVFARSSNYATRQRQLPHSAPAAAAKSTTGPSRVAVRSLRQQIASRYFEKPPRSPISRAAEGGAQSRAGRSGFQPELRVPVSAAGKAYEHRWVDGATVPLAFLVWKTDANVRSDALEASYWADFDLVAEWKHAVSELASMNVWPEEMLKIVDEFPP
jgi:hypothetical protein